MIPVNIEPWRTSLVSGILHLEGLCEVRITFILFLHCVLCKRLSMLVIVNRCQKTNALLKLLLLISLYQSTLPHPVAILDGRELSTERQTKSIVRNGSDYAKGSKNLGKS